MAATKIWDIRDVGLAGLTLTNMSGIVNADNNFQFNYTNVNPNWGLINPVASPLPALNGYYLHILGMSTLGLGRYINSFYWLRDIGGTAMLPPPNAQFDITQINTPNPVTFNFDYIRHYGDKIVTTWQVWYSTEPMANDWVSLNASSPVSHPRISSPDLIGGLG